MTAERHFNEQLVEFLSCRTEQSGSFFLGAWLQTLDDEMLSALCIAASRFRKDAQDSADLAILCAIAFAAESGGSTLRVAKDAPAQWANSMYVAGNLEVARRKGLVVLRAPLSIKLDAAFEICLTEKGISAAKSTAGSMQ